MENKVGRNVVGGKDVRKGVKNNRKSRKVSCTAEDYTGGRNVGLQCLA